MARRRSERGKELKRLEEEGNHYWMSYSDLMSALLLIFALLLMVNMYNNQKEMEAKDQMIQDIIGVKTELIEELRNTFQNSDLQMQIDPKTGAIRFSNGVFFEYNSSEISEEGRSNLETFVPEYINILLSERFRPHISQIIIEGHTDKEGGYMYNLELSQERSYAVVNEIMGEDFPDFQHKTELRDIVTSNGRSFSEPILNDDEEIDPERSRRVEFKFRLKDEEVIENIQELVNDNG